MRIRCTDDGLTFRRYPFRPASVRRNRKLPWSRIRNIDPDAFPPEIRTVEGETLFVPAKQADELSAASDAAGVPIVHRIDVWALLLEPYLDTSFDAEDQERTLVRLEGCGVSRQETRSIRRRVGATMLAYNSVVWDWVHLGLYDLLTATRRTPTFLSLRHWLSPRRYDDLYRWAMEIADRGPVYSGLDPEIDAMVNVVNRQARELCTRLGHNSLNYTVSLRLFSATNAAGESAEAIVRRAIGEAATLGGEPAVATLDEMLAEIESCLRFEGDAGAHPNPGFPTSVDFDRRLESLQGRLRAACAEAETIHSVWFSDGHPFYPVFWDFAFVIERGRDGFVLVGSSSD